MIDLPKLFRRLGRLAGLLKAVAGHQQASLAGGIGDLAAEFTALPGPVAALSRAVLVPAAGPGQVLANVNLEILVVDAARRTLLETLRADQPNEAWDVPKAVAEVIRQMKAAGQTVPACAIAYSLSSSPLFANPGEVNAGDGEVLVGLRQPNYVASDNVFAEQLRLSVTDDADLFNESWVARGGVTASGLWSYDWPLGSGAVSTLTTCDPAGEPGDGDGQTILADGSFEEWIDASTLESWTDTNCARSSAAGTAYNEFSGETRYSVSLVGTGGSPGVASLYQVLDTDFIKGSTAYGISFRCRLSAAANFTTFTAATIRAQLEDANAGTVLADVGGNNLRVEKVFSAHSETWFHVSGVWVTPRRLPAAVRLKISTEAINIVAAGGFATLGYVDHVALFALKYHYPGGPALGIVAGNRPWREGDSLEVTVTNDRAGALFGYTWQSVFDRFFGNRPNFLYLPTSASPTVGDFLIDAGGVPIGPPPPPPPSVSGSLAVHVFNDANGNATQDAGDTDAPNRLVYLLGPVNANGTTDSSGNVTFAALPVGSYSVFVSLAGSSERCDENGNAAVVSNGGTTTATRGIEPVSPPAPPAWDLAVRTNRPFRAVTAVGAATYNGFTDPAGNVTFRNVTGPAATAYTVTLQQGGDVSALWNSYSDPNANQGTGFIANLVLGTGTGPQPTAVVNIAASSPEDPPLNGRFRVILRNAVGDGIAGRTVTINTYGLSGTTNGAGIVDFVSPLIQRGDAVQITVQSNAAAATWTFHGHRTGSNYPGPVTSNGTGYVGAGAVAGSAPGGGTADGLAIWTQNSGAGTYSINGTVTVNGFPAARDIQLTGSATGSLTSDPVTGNYSFTGLAAGTYTVTVDVLAGETSTPANYTGLVVPGSHFDKDFAITGP